MAMPNTVTIAGSAADAALLAEAGTNGTRTTIAEGSWRLFGGLYGLPAHIETLLPIVESTLASIDGARMLDEAAVAQDPAAAMRVGLMRGDPAFSHTGPAATNSWLSISAPLEGAAVGNIARLVDDDGERDADLCGGTVHCRAAIVVVDKRAYDDACRARLRRRSRRRRDDRSRLDRCAEPPRRPAGALDDDRHGDPHGHLPPLSTNASGRTSRLLVAGLTARCVGTG